MKNYIALAHSTSSPLPPARERLQNFPVLALLYFKLRELAKLGSDLDDLKRAIFYGSPDITGTMTLPEAQAANAARALEDDQTIELLHAGLGLATESVEFLAAVFDRMFEGYDLDETNLSEEIGDSLWYLAKGCKFLGTTLELEMVRNIGKLAARYPNKFTNLDALNRDLDRERKALESALPAAD